MTSATMSISTQQLPLQPFRSKFFAAWRHNSIRDARPQYIWPARGRQCGFYWSSDIVTRWARTMLAVRLHDGRRIVAGSPAEPLLTVKWRVYKRRLWLASQLCWPAQRVGLGGREVNAKCVTYQLVYYRYRGLYRLVLLCVSYDVGLDINAFSPWENPIGERTCECKPSLLIRVSSARS